MYNNIIFVFLVGFIFQLQRILEFPKVGKYNIYTPFRYSLVLSVIEQRKRLNPNF